MNDPRIKDHHKILLEAVNRYRSLKDEDLWNPSITTKQQSAFHTVVNQPKALNVGTSNNVAGNGKLQTHDKMGRPINRVPPGPGEPTTHLTTDGRTEDWCNSCGRWGNHHDNGHEEFRARFDKWARQRKTAKPGDRGSANVASPTFNSAPENYHDQSELVTEVAGNTTTARDNLWARQESVANMDERLRIPKLPTTNFSMGHF
jgi:hypothetical protein